MNSGKIIVFSGPSGVGKSRIIEYLLSLDDNKYCPVITATTREKRYNHGQLEVDGVDYYFMTEEEFRSKIESGYFVEWEEVYPGRLYGIPLSSIHFLLQSRRIGVIDLDYKGAMKIKQQFGSIVTTVFVLPPSLQELEQRLRSRSGELSESKIQDRMNRAKLEIQSSNLFDYTITNGDWELTKNIVKTLINKRILLDNNEQ